MNNLMANSWLLIGNQEAIAYFCLLFGRSLSCLVSLIPWTFGGGGVTLAWSMCKICRYVRKHRDQIECAQVINLVILQAKRAVAALSADIRMLTHGVGL